jgi:hypothetical protein
MSDIIDSIFERVMEEDCVNPLRRFADLLREDEREACARLCESLGAEGYGSLAIAAEIRKRGEK